MSETIMLILSGQTEFHSCTNGHENRIEEGLANGEHFAYDKMKEVAFFNKDV